MSRLLMAASAAALLSSCGSEPAKPPAAEKPRTLLAGEYEVVSEVTKLASTDRKTPATTLRMGGVETIRACVAADGTVDPAMFVERGDRCTVLNSFARSGRLSIQYDCTRAGTGALYPNVDGNYTDEGFKALVTVGTAFPGDGDYTLTRTLNARRIGACPAAGPARS